MRCIFVTGPGKDHQAYGIMEEKDILRIALIILLLGFSLPGLFRSRVPGVHHKENNAEQEDAIRTDPPR